MTPEQIESLYLAAKRNPDILGIHKVAEGLLGVWAQAARLKERNEKLEKVVEAAKAWLAVADIYSQHRSSADRHVYKLDYMQGREIFRDALYELEQL